MSLGEKTNGIACLAALALWVGPANAEGPAWEPTPFDPTIEVLSDGSRFRHALSEDLVPQDDVVEGALTWRYVGQAEFLVGAGAFEPSGSEWVVETGYIAPLIERFLSTERVDSLGRRWQVVSVDTAEIERMVADYDSLAGSESGDSWEDPYLEPSASAPDELIAGWVSHDAWETDSCSNDTIHRWNNDGRGKVTGSSLSDGRKGVVQLHRRVFNPITCAPTGWCPWSRACSGVMVGNTWVLTAAHCVTYEGTGDEISLGALGVCSRGNTYSGSQCQAGVASIIAGPDWDGSGHGDDYALVELTAPWTSANPAYYLSTVSDLTSIEPHTNLAYPGYGNSCASTVAPANNSSYTGTYLYEQVGTVVASTSTLWRSQHDGVGGHSGSPIYHCPAGSDDLCLSGEARYVTGIWSGWYTDLLFTHGHRGPKASVFRSWAIGLMD